MPWRYAEGGSGSTNGSPIGTGRVNVTRGEHGFTEGIRVCLENL